MLYHFIPGKKIPLIYHVFQQFRNQQGDAPSSISHTLKSQKVCYTRVWNWTGKNLVFNFRDWLQTNSLWTNNRSSTSYPNSSNAPSATITSKTNEVIQKTFDGSKERRNTTSSQIPSVTDDVEWTEWDDFSFVFALIVPYPGGFFMSQPSCLGIWNLNQRVAKTLSILISTNLIRVYWATCLRCPHLLTLVRVAWTQLINHRSRWINWKQCS